MTTQSNSCRPRQNMHRSSRTRPQYFNHLPRVNVTRNEDAVSFYMAIPGIDKKDITIQLENDQLTVSHEVTEKLERKYLRKGFDLRGFSRSFKLSNDVNPSGIEANFEGGILHLLLPIKEAAKPKTITIQ